MRVSTASRALITGTICAVAVALAPFPAMASSPGGACDPELGPVSGCAMQAVTVPADPADPGAAHLTYSGASITLEGIARYGGNQFRWDFGDGSSPTTWMTIANQANLGVAHVYNGPVGQLFTATLSVRNSSDPSVVASASYPVRISLSSGPDPVATDLRARMAVDRALWFLHLQQTRSTYPLGSPGNGQPYGTWGSGSGASVSATCTAVDALEMLGHTPTGDYAGDPYVEDVRRGLNYALANAGHMNIPLGKTYQNTNQSAVIDQNHNGIGIDFGGDKVGITGACAQALADSGAPDRVAASGQQGNVAGRTYASILQDVVDYFGYAQVGGGPALGSWGYTSLYSTFAPMDTTWWVPRLIDTIGTRMSGAGIAVSPLVLGELAGALSRIALTEQTMNNGAFQHAWGGSYLPEIRTTGEGIEAERAVGYGPVYPYVQRALGFLYRNWNGTGVGGCWGAHLGWSEAMYRTADALLRAQPTLTRITDYNYFLGQQTGNGFDWYYTPAGQTQPGYATYLITRQFADGSWHDTAGCGVADDDTGGTVAETTARDLLVLAKNGTLTVPEITPFSWTGQTPAEGGVVAAVAGTPVTVTLSVTGGLSPYTFRDAGMPSGATLASAGADATFSWTPPAAGDTRVVVEAIDSLGLKTLRSFTVRVPSPLPTLDWRAPSAITYGTALSSTQLDATVTAPGSSTPMAGTYAYTVDDGTADARYVVLPAGAHTLHVTFTPADTTLDPVTGSVPLTVDPAPLTVTADPQNRAYGAENPELTANLSGFVNGDTATGATTGAPDCTTDADSASHVGSYPITCTIGTLAAANYTVTTFIPGTLSVTPALLTITADDQAQTYGGALPRLTATINGFVNLDTAGSATTGAPDCTTTATDPIGVGTYPITCTAGSLTTNGDYLLDTFVPGTLTVAAAPLTVTADDQTRLYGASDPAFSATLSGFVNGDTADTATTGAPACTTDAGQGSGVGAYVISCTAGSLHVGDNYTVAAFHPGTLTITPAPLTLTAAGQSRAYGAANPPLTGDVTGFVNGDSPAVLSGSPSCSTTADSSSPVGSYPITCTAGTLTAANYAVVTFADGTLQVTPAPLTVTAADQSRTYGAADPALTGDVTGFVNGDTSAVLSGAPSCTTTATTSSGVGSYPISCTAGTLTAANYAVTTLVRGTLQVTPAPLTLAADSNTRPFGAANPALTATPTGFVNGDTPAVLSGAASCTTTATTSSAVGTYLIDCTAGTLTAANYAVVTLLPGTLTVTPAQLLVTADPQSRLFGAANPPLTATITGFLNGDTAATATTGSPSCTTSASTASAVGKYPITCTAGTLSSPNYSFTFAGGSLAVTATRTITGMSIGAVTIGAGQAVLLAPGATVVGPVTITPGGALDVEGGTILGLIRSGGANAVRMCAARVVAPISIAGSIGPVVLGGDGCAPSTVVGPITLTGNTGGVSVVGATVYGALTITGTRGGFAYAGNKVSGPVRLSDNR